MNKRFGIPLPTKKRENLFSTNDENKKLGINDYTAYLEKNLSLLTNEQSFIFNSIIDSIYNNKNLNFVINAKAGTGKTTVLHLITAFVRYDII